MKMWQQVQHDDTEDIGTKHQEHEELGRVCRFLDNCAQLQARKLSDGCKWPTQQAVAYLTASHSAAAQQIPEHPQQYEALHLS